MIACPQCGSPECGPYRCRFSGLTHTTYRTQKVNEYADRIIRRDKEQPQWLRDFKTGAKEPQ